MSTTDLRATTRPVVVGVDGRPHTRNALDWAIDEAVRRRCAIKLVHGRSVPVQGPHIEPLMAASDEVAKRVLHEAEQRIHSVSPSTPVSTATGIGSPGALLVDASTGAGLVVVGARGRGTVSSAFLGSSSVDVAARAHCPVVVVRELPTTSSPASGVVVGSDGSPLSTTAIGEAFDEAHARQAPLTVVHTWLLDYDDSNFPLVDAEALQDKMVRQASDLTAQAVADWSQKFPDVDVRVRVLNAHPVEALAELSREAELVVVGSRGRGGFRGLLLGSVSQGVLHHAHCPVMVVRPEPD
ncbi:universal stress protein [Pedococcus sp. 2YAF34]|uniref:universal stress protein n=1 Tax=Pedococcus sp. 2YAF34 TaxID=3233032 RepID=UPI003F9C7B20